ncbi:MAG: NAD-dependent epimerase/dehydratase family protein [Deltaproteobacteria bacterium]|jgi:dihydroflavonol-4-reductase
MNLVTGASGFIGGSIVHALVERGEDVRILIRPGADLRGLNGVKVDRRLGDVTDWRSVEQAARGCRRIYHAAALYRLWLRNPEVMYTINVEGTRNLIRAGLEAGAERIVHTSSVATIGLPSAAWGCEETPVSLKDMVGDYKRSKFLAEEVVLKFAEQGAPVVVVNPTYPVGKGDVKPSPTGKMIVDFLQGRMPAYLDTGLNVIDVDDVAAGHLAAADRGRVGRRYILGNCNMTLKEILYTLAEITGLRRPLGKLPFYPVLGLSYLDAALAKLLRGREPRIPPDGVRMARKKMFVDSSRAVAELGLPQTPPREALVKAIEWFRKNGYV